MTCEDIGWVGYSIDLGLYCELLEAGPFTVIIRHEDGVKEQSNTACHSAIREKYVESLKP